MKKIEFIICTNQLNYEEECIFYIKHLNVPIDYSVSIQIIRDAASMASGYQKAMEASDADIKIYLHHDTFLVNKNILIELVELFRDSSIGMIGCVGNKKLPKDLLMVHYDTGKVRMQSGYGVMTVSDHITHTERYAEVLCADGCFLATQVDVPWREDIFDGWDFYDIAHGYEMRKAGYKVIVPYVENSWVYHDCGPSNMERYFDYQKKFMNEYLKESDWSIDETQERARRQLCEMAKQVGVQIKQMVINHQYSTVLQLSNQLIASGAINDDICHAIHLAELHQRSSVHNQWLFELGFEQSKKVLCELRFHLIRYKNGYESDCMKEYLDSNKLNNEMINYLLEVF